jgi:hypothetical protein
MIGMQFCIKGCPMAPITAPNITIQNLYIIMPRIHTYIITNPPPNIRDDLTPYFPMIVLASSSEENGYSHPYSTVHMSTNSTETPNPFTVLVIIELKKT